MGRNYRHIAESLESHIDWVATITLLCIGSFGLFLLLTINQAFFVQQVVFLLVGIILLVSASLLHPAILWWLAPFGYIWSLIFLVITYVGPAVRGSHRWIFIAGQQLQPSEFVKPLLLLFFTWAITRFPPRKLKYIPFHVMLFLIPFFLVLQQPDLGTSLVYASFWLAMMLAGGLSLPLVIVSGAIFTLALPGIWNQLAPYQRDRITTFVNPGFDPSGAGYNALQAMIAVGSGQLFGRGLGRGTQSHLRFLPEHHTDFIFATLVEELGFVGGSLLLVGYAYLLWRVIAPLVGETLTDAYPYIFTIGLFAMILTQIFINTGMNMGIIPITGITLPFVSYGGSSILSLCLSFGLLWAIRSPKA